MHVYEEYLCCCFRTVLFRIFLYCLYRLYGSTAFGKLGQKTLSELSKVIFSVLYLMVNLEAQEFMYF